MGSISGTSICEALEKEPSRPSEKLKISVTGAASPLGYAVCLYLKKQGHYVIASDWTKNEYMAEDEFCDEYHVFDLRHMDNCLEATRGADRVYNLAMSLGGLRFSESESSATEDDYTVVGYNMAEAARINGVQRFLHASAAVLLQVETNADFKESFAWLAERQYPHGFEELGTEKLCMRYHKDFGFQYRIARFYCIYGPSRAWEGGSGEAPAAFCGEGSTFTIYHKYAEDVLRLMMSDSRDPVFVGCLDWREPVNIQSDKIESENETAEMGLSLEENLPILPIPGPEGIGGRNSDDAGIEEKVGCAEVLKNWLGMTCFWIKERIEKVKAKGIDSSIDGSSEVVVSEAPVELGSLRTAEGKE